MSTLIIIFEKYGINFILLLYIWYKEYCFNRRLQEFERILLKAVRFWRENNE